MFVYGLLKTPLLAPYAQVPANSAYLDSLAELRFLTNTMSPEEFIPMLSPQIYTVSNYDLSEENWPEVSDCPKWVNFDGVTAGAS